jgi:hypothetical protein
MIDPDCRNCIVVEAEVRSGGLMMRLLRGLWQTYLEGAAVYGGILGYPSLEYPPPNTDEQRTSRIWPGE